MWSEDVTCGSKEMMDAAYKSGKDKRILRNESYFGKESKHKRRNTKNYP